MADDIPISDLEELAALYAAGALSPDEAAAVESRLDAGDRSLAEEIASYETVLAALVEDVEPVVPEPKTREGLLERVSGTKSGELQQPAANNQMEGLPSGIVIRLAEARDWVDFGIPGVQECLLHHDPARKSQTKLIRMAPGSTLPAHRHRVVEECFLLEGEVDMYARVLRAGDYMIAHPGTFHPRSRTEHGCLFLLVTGMHASPSA
jgi:anti-sigma factor ChrR (cupin superfamily)